MMNLKPANIKIMSRIVVSINYLFYDSKESVFTE